MLVESLFSCLLPPIGILLYLFIAATISLRRIITTCDEKGVTHQSWLARRTIPWDEIETCDLSILWIRLRARNGHVMRISHWPLFGNARARRELYAEIRCRAPHAHADRKTDD